MPGRQVRGLHVPGPHAPGLHTLGLQLGLQAVLGEQAINGLFGLGQQVAKKPAGMQTRGEQKGFGQQAGKQMVPVVVTVVVSRSSYPIPYHSSISGG